MRMILSGRIEDIDMDNKENDIRNLLNSLSKDLESNHNRKTLGLRSHEEYIVEKESLVEDVIRKLINLDVINEIRKLQDKLL